MTDQHQKYERMIEEIDSKDKSQILDEVLTEIKNDDEVKSKRPELDDDIFQRTFDLPTDKQLGMYYNVEGIGQLNVVYIRIANLLNNGISPNIGIFGKSQRGKSNTALVIANKLHNELNMLRGEFEPRYQTIYEVIPFLLFYRYYARRMAMFEEAGETVNKNDYNSKMNRAVAGTLRTQGKRQIPNCFITPEASELDPRIRDNLDIEIEMVSTGKAKVTFYERIFGKKSENMSRNYNFGKVSGTWDVPKAPKKMRRKYEEIDSGYKGRYLDELLMDTIQEKLEEEKEKDLLEF